MDVRLVIAEGPAQKRALHLRNDEGVIGRQKGCDIRIPSAEVSRRHCVLRARDGYVTVEDLDSRNGTRLNGESVTGRQVVRPGDRLTVGPITFVVEYQLTSEAMNRLLRGEGGDEGSSEVEVVEVEEVEGSSAEEDAALSALAAQLEDVSDPGPAPEDLPAVTPVEEESMPAALPLEEEAAPVDRLEVVDEDWQLPETEELRDILTGLDEDESPPPKKKRKK